MGQPLRGERNESSRDIPHTEACQRAPTRGADPSPRVWRREALVSSMPHSSLLPPLHSPRVAPGLGPDGKERTGVTVPFGSTY
jgi:hypothetical protein